MVVEESESSQSSSSLSSPVSVDDDEEGTGVPCQGGVSPRWNSRSQESPFTSSSSEAADLFVGFGVGGVVVVAVATSGLTVGGEGVLIAGLAVDAGGEEVVMLAAMLFSAETAHNSSNDDMGFLVVMIVASSVTGRTDEGDVVLVTVLGR